MPKLSCCPSAAQPWAGTGLCLGDCTQKGLLPRNNTGVLLKPGGLPCWQGAGTSARLLAGHSP